jgi:hypothetical protein
MGSRLRGEAPLALYKRARGNDGFKMGSRLRRKRPSHWTNMQNTLGYNNILGLGGE